MNKSLIIIVAVLIALALLGGVFLAYLFFQDSPENNKETKETKASLEISEEKIEEETDDLIVSVRYPKTNNKKINQEIDNLIESEIDNFKESIMDPIEGLASGIYISYIVSLNSPTILSIIFDISIYPSGAAHPVSNTNIFNYDLDKERRIDNKEIFTGNYLDVLSEICTERLIEKIEPDEFMINSIYSGAGPTEENYEHIALTENGIVVIFEQYQVAAYVLGKQSIEILASEISDVLK